MQRFKYYLHDGYTSHERRETMEAQGVELPEEAWENVGGLFYEVGLLCEVDDRGQVKIVEVI